MAPHAIINAVNGGCYCRYPNEQLLNECIFTAASRDGIPTSLYERLLGD